MSRLGLGSVGVALSVSERYLDEAAELEGMGYSAVWLPGGQIDALGRLADLAAATTAVPVGASVISLDVYAPAQVAGLYAQPGWAAPKPASPQLSDRLVDELIIWGSPETIAARIGQQLDAGADHVVLHVLSEPGQPGPAEVARTLAGHR